MKRTKNPEHCFRKKKTNSDLRTIRSHCGRIQLICLHRCRVRREVENICKTRCFTLVFLTLGMFLIPVSVHAATLNVEVRVCKNNLYGCYNSLQDAEVYVNGRFIGITNDYGMARVHSLPAGRYQAKVKKRGYKTQAKSCRLTSNEYESLLFYMEKAKPVSTEDASSSRNRDHFESYIIIRVNYGEGKYDDVQVVLGKGRSREHVLYRRNSGHSRFRVTSPGYYWVRISKNGYHTIKTGTEVESNGIYKRYRSTLEPLTANSEAEVSPTKNDETIKQESDAPTFIELLTQFLGTYWPFIVSPVCLLAAFYLMVSPDSSHSQHERREQTATETTENSSSGENSSSESSELQVDEDSIHDIFQLGRNE